ncbi:iron-sulfur cluster insertion protein ErpA [Carboxydochorda subterranea]|uniref:Iron-sulfur cluster insertion protein ErpA n=1 Tax=Carboxydichorda subterranea TaxID=3109565 RepID=A0ABZ1BXM8_9FIRM|nr:iron-sulfur cluster insertion protein ErpA [Limnochorda sp. L945t]WRP17436.1 iron-sulfur cluster insertion protein ErpA [Limnochorda sp. L945t]
MLTLTAEASARLRELLEQKQRPELLLRIYVQPGGCRGYSYGMAFDDKVREGDTVVEQDGLRIAVDPFSVEFLQGAEVGYVESLMGGGFTIRNPNAVSTCGCGQSFRTAKDRGKPQSCCGGAG